MPPLLSPFLLMNETGTLAGDYGYDPLGLATDAATIEKYRTNELLHAR